VFAAEMTTAVETCATCGASEPIGATHVFRGAGFVLRCPHCGTVLLTIVRTETDVRIGMGAVRTLRLGG
jgi:uncharacterized Zn finger protein